MRDVLRRWLRIPERHAPEEEDAATRALVERARALPREALPQRDLWLGIRNQIAQQNARILENALAPAGLVIGNAQ